MKRQGSSLSFFCSSLTYICKADQDLRKVNNSTFEKGDKAIIVGGVIDNSGLTETSVTVCTIQEVGEADLLVKFERSSLSPRIVSKKSCIPVNVTPTNLLNSSPLKPSLGDMVFYCGKVNWRDKEETTYIGTVYEVKFKDGHPHSATLHVGTDMISLPYDELLVLQTLEMS